MGIDNIILLNLFYGIYMKAVGSVQDYTICKMYSFK